MDAITILQNAAGMTYAALGEILARSGKKLETVLLNAE